MTTRPMSAAMEAALEGDILYPIYFFAIGFDQTTLYLWTGFGDRDWNGQTWQGVGWILGMSEVEETAETKATTFTIGTQANPTLIAACLLNFRKNKPCTIWQGLLAPGYRIGNPAIPYALGNPVTGTVLGMPTGTLLEDPIVIASGLTSMNQIGTDPEKPAISISCESRIADLERARVRRYTHEDHQIDYPGDLFFQYADADKTLTWGKGA